MDTHERLHLRRIATMIILTALGGCSWLPFGQDDKDKADAAHRDAAPELEHCTLKVSACRNSCYKASAGSKCVDCCERNADACDRGESYGFYTCPDEE